MVQVAVNLEEYFLVNVSGVFRAVQNVQRQPQDVAVVPMHQLLERRSVTRLRSLNHELIGFLIQLRLDGRMVKARRAGHWRHGSRAIETGIETRSAHIRYCPCFKRPTSPRLLVPGLSESTANRSRGDRLFIRRVDVSKRKRTVTQKCPGESMV
jgi:hypothetical protein